MFGSYMCMATFANNLINVYSALSRSVVMQNIISPHFDKDFLRATLCNYTHILNSVELNLRF